MFIYFNYTKQKTSKKPIGRFYFYDQEFSHLILNSSSKVSEVYNFKNCTKELTTPPRILCTVFTHQKSLYSKALAVNQTWGPSCDTLLFVVTDQYASLKRKPKLRYAFLKNLDEDYRTLTIKTIKAILYVYRYHKNDYDWMLKADDDTYVIVDNLRIFLQQKCTDEPYTYGYRFENNAINSGGAGYVLNSRTVNTFVHAYFTNKTFCKHELLGFEDVDMANCLRELGVTPGDSRDSSGLERFHSHNIKEDREEAKSKNQATFLYFG
jgi:glycoprotein-N-acetylgalactosamine 3-beta-galactosyltransferase